MSGEASSKIGTDLFHPLLIRPSEGSLHIGINIEHSKNLTCRAKYWNHQFRTRAGRAGNVLRPSTNVINTLSPSGAGRCATNSAI